MMKKMKLDIFLMLTVAVVAAAPVAHVLGESLISISICIIRFLFFGEFGLYAEKY